MTATDTTAAAPPARGLRAWLLTRSLLQSMPRLCRVSISLNSVGRSTTTPLPMTGTMCGYSTPLGMSCRAYFSVPTTTVWPAL